MLPAALIAWAGHGRACNPCINPEIYDYAAAATPNAGGTCFYFVSAELEKNDNLFPPEVIYQSQLDMVASLTSAGSDTHRIHTDVRDVREHGWAFMGHEFPAAYDWTMNACSVSTAAEETPVPSEPAIDVWPNPGRDVLNVRVPNGRPDARVEVFDLLGRRVGGQTMGFGHGRIETDDLAPVRYVIRVDGEVKTWIRQ